MFTDQIDPILTDFGLVRIMHATTQTASGLVSGTPAYISPEQAQGLRTDHRSDIYSLGVVLYEILVLTSKRSYREKMTAFFQFISGMIANGRRLETESILFTGTVDLLNDPDIKKIRTEAQEKMIHLRLGLMREGKQQGHVNPDLTEEALSVYFSAFREIFTSPKLQQRFHHQPDLVRQLGSLMIDGLSGKPMEDSE